MRRWSSRIVVAAVSLARYVHDRPFRHATAEEIASEAHETAKEALLQFNLMIHRGVEPDALTYTSLIATMGRAKLEWQAYKLFSRMLEQKVRPLPETYLALRDATSPKRQKLIEDLDAKMREAIEQLPSQLAKEDADRRRELDRQCVDRFEEYMKGEIPKLPEQANKELQIAESPDTDPRSSQADSSAHPQDNEPYATVHIRSPADAWSAHKALEEARMKENAEGCIAVGEERSHLTAELMKLHEEELRVYLTVKRQLRHGAKEMLVQRILDNVGHVALKTMLQRRKKYFTAVGDVLKMDLDALKAQGSAEDAPPTQASPRQDADDEGKTTMVTPWGVIRKPQRSNIALVEGSPRNEEKLERIRLSGEEISLIRNKIKLEELDDVPMSLLRRYAYQHSLGWNRSLPESLPKIVAWHVNAHVNALQPSPSIRARASSAAMKETLENFEAFRIISQRTKNLQVVDSKEINLHIKAGHRDRTTRDTRVETQLRRERHLQEADDLVKQSREFVATPEEVETPSSVLGLDGGNELPPWALEADTGDRLNFKTGRFGDRLEGRYQELSDGKFRVLPSRVSQSTHSVDMNLLPSEVRDQITTAKRNEEQRDEVLAAELEEKRQYKKFQRFDQFVRRAKEKKVKDREEGGVRPLQPPRRMYQRLQVGADRKKLRESEVQEFLKREE